eukprot:5954764-Pyramimonas_sp.AAC.1
MVGKKNDSLIALPLLELKGWALTDSQLKRTYNETLSQQSHLARSGETDQVLATGWVFGQDGLTCQIRAIGFPHSIPHALTPQITSLDPPHPPPLSSHDEQLVGRVFDVQEATLCAALGS